MARRRDAFQLTLAVALIVAATLVEGASAARKASEQTSRRLSQLDQLWSNGAMPKHAVLYDTQYFNGKGLRLRIGDNPLNKAWIKRAKSLWLPDGYKAVLTYGRYKFKVIAYNHAVAFEPSYLEALSGTVPGNLEGQITGIQVSVDMTWTQRIVKEINERRTNSRLGYIALNEKVNDFAYKLCQSDAHAGSFAELDLSDLSHQLKKANVFNYAVGVVRERGVRKAIDAVAKLYAAKPSARLLAETKWAEMGVAYAKHHFGESNFFVCVVLVNH